MDDLDGRVAASQGAGASAEVELVVLDSQEEQQGEQQEEQQGEQQDVQQEEKRGEQQDEKQEEKQEEKEEEKQKEQQEEKQEENQKEQQEGEHLAAGSGLAAAGTEKGLVEESPEAAQIKMRQLEEELARMKKLHAAKILICK